MQDALYYRRYVTQALAKTTAELDEMVESAVTESAKDEVYRNQIRLRKYVYQIKKALYKVHYWLTPTEMKPISPTTRQRVLEPNRTTLYKPRRIPQHPFGLPPPQRYPHPPWKWGLRKPVDNESLHNGDFEYLRRCSRRRYNSLTFCPLVTSGHF